MKNVAAKSDKTDKTDKDDERVRVAASDLRADLANVLNRVAYRGERLVLQRHGRDVAVLVPVEDLRLLEVLEDHVDVAAAREVLKEAGTIPWTKVKKKLGL